MRSVVRPVITPGPPSSAVAATSTTPRSRPPNDAAAGLERVAIVDIDAHHGNGTQAIFWNDPAVFYGSVHVDPAAGWFPTPSVTPTRSTTPPPIATCRSTPVPTDGAWLEACASLLADVVRFEPDAVVVSLGVDAARDDPNSPLRHPCRIQCGWSDDRRPRSAPRCIVQEGGYVLQTLAGLTLLVLEGFES